MLESEVPSIVVTGEPAHEAPRHPWTCQAKLGKTRTTCGRKNRARDTNCRACGAEYYVPARNEYEPESELAERVTVTQAVREWRALRAEIVECFRRMANIEKRLGTLFEDGGSSISVRDRHNHAGLDFEDPEPALVETQRKVWRCIMDKLEVQRFVSDRRWKEITDQLESDDLPEITTENVAAWQRQVMGSMDDLLREKVTEVYNHLRPWRAHHKTNVKNATFELGKKVILEYSLDAQPMFCSWRPRLRYDNQQKWRSIESLFRTLDGKGYSTQNFESEVEGAIKNADPETGVCETEYFELRACRNGNLHVTFKRMDLVAKLNAIAGGKNLRGERRGRDT